VTFQVIEQMFMILDEKVKLYHIITKCKRLTLFDNVVLCDVELEDMRLDNSHRASVSKGQHVKRTLSTVRRRETSSCTAC